MIELELYQTPHKKNISFLFCVCSVCLDVTKDEFAIMILKNFLFLMM